MHTGGGEAYVYLLLLQANLQLGARFGVVVQHGLQPPHERPYRLRALIYRAAFGQLFEHAARLGMEVFVTTDMQWSTPPMHAYAGRMSASNRLLADLNRWALDELFEVFPQVRGLVVRELHAALREAAVGVGANPHGLADACAPDLRFRQQAPPRRNRATAYLAR